MVSYPNQRIVTIHKPKYEANFLQVSISEWQEAYVRLERKGSFGLYLYLCSNMDGFPLALSSADIQKCLHVSDSTYRRAVEDLLGEGYLIQRNGNEHTLDFYTTPQPTTYVKKERKKAAMDGGAAGAEPVSVDESPCGPSAYEKSSYTPCASLSQYEWVEP